MTSSVWNQLITIQSSLEKRFETCSEETFEEDMGQFNREDWINRTWHSDVFRRAHVNVVDARKQKGLWMMHCCIFPHFETDGPIFGLDVVAGKSKITGFFHDYSPTTNPSHPMITAFEHIVSKYEWKKERDLPEWAKAIFTSSMVAAGNVREGPELDQLMELSLDSVEYYIEAIEKQSVDVDKYESIAAQNRYAYFQKQNPHLYRSMEALGLSEVEAKIFVEKCLFPEEVVDNS